MTMAGNERPGAEGARAAASSVDGPAAAWDYSAAMLDLDPMEMRVLDIAHQLMEKHYVLIMEDLLKEASRTYKQEGKASIMHAIDTLVRKKVLFERKAITKATILNNPVRKAIFEWIVFEPGIHFSRLRDLLQRDSKSIAMHIGMLKQFGLVRSVEFDNNTVYFDAALDTLFDQLHYYTHKKYVLEAFKAILEHPNISLIDLYSILKLDITENAFLRKINTLVTLGFLSAMRDEGRIIALRVHPRIESKVKEIIARKSGEYPREDDPSTNPAKSYNNQS